MCCFGGHNTRDVSVPAPLAIISLTNESEEESHIRLAQQPTRRSINLRAVLGVPGLAEGERHIAVLDHVLDLLLHGKEEQDEPVDDENGPEHRDIEEGEEAADQGDGDGASSRVPELEFGESPDEGAELLVLLGREGADRAVLHIVVERIVGRVELWREKGEEEIQQVDTESVCDDIPALRNKDADEEEEQGDTGSNPPIEHIGRRLIEKRLVLPC